MTRIVTPADVQGLFDRVAEQRRDDEVLRRHGINPASFEEWLIEDVLETLSNPDGPFTGVTRLSPTMLGALISTHIRMAFEAGLLYGAKEVT
jgi:hypothetical protein